MASATISPPSVMQVDSWLLYMPVFQLGIFLRALCPALFELKIIFFFLQIVIAVFVFADRGVKMLVKCLQICAHVFIDRPQNCAQTSFRSSRSKLCPNFGCSRARLCQISFAPCPFPNLAGTLHSAMIGHKRMVRARRFRLQCSFNAILAEPAPTIEI